MTINWEQLERNEISSQQYTHNEWLMIRDRFKLMDLRLQAHLLDSYLSECDLEKKEGETK